MGRSNREVLQAVAVELGLLRERLVLVGGHVAELLITSPGVTRVRPTLDVDVIVGTTRRIDYAAVEAELRALGFRHDAREDAPVCRWISPSEVVLDVMPPDESVLGFTNPWYSEALNTAGNYLLDGEITIRVPHPPVFLAMKWAAVEDRAKDDLLGSRDMEDIIAVVAGRPELVDEVGDAAPGVRAYVAQRAARFLEHRDAEYALAGALPDASRVPDLIPLVRTRFERIADQGGD